MATPAPSGPPSGPPGPVPPRSVTVQVTNTYRQLVLAAFTASRALVITPAVLAAVVLWSLLQGEVLRAVLALLLLLLLLGTVLRAVRGALARGSGSVTWTIDASGFRVVTAVADAGLAWSQVREVVGRGSFVLFAASTRLPLPRRCATPDDLAAIEDLARWAGVPTVRGVVRAGR